MVILLILVLFGCQIFETLSQTDRCLQPLDSGPCQFYQRRFYYDRAKRQCLAFDYGGCLGTTNRFGTEHECTQECVYQLKYKTKMPEICLMPRNAGVCTENAKSNGQIWHYFDSESGLCEQFTYFGCAPGNQNRFYSLYQCRSVCGERFDPQIACERCDSRTSECKALSKYTYVCECRKGYLKTDRGECIDMDECDLMQAECHENARCINTIGSYRCECVEDYVGDGKKECRYVGTQSIANKCDECDENSICINNKCRCKVGFFGNGVNCTDVNECEAKEWPCDLNAECINTQGSFYCECVHGYAGNGHRCTQNPMACLDKFDARYKEACNGAEWHMHYHLDHSNKQCSMFWYDGCLADSTNIFSQLHTCEDLCVRTNILSKADVCWDKFDSNLRNQCSRGEWQQRYFYDHASMTCQLFWYDGCKTSSRNMFEDLLTCQWLCEEEPRYKTRACLEMFDEHYRDECNGGLWRQNYFFDKQKMRCVPFWYDGCTGVSANLFPDLSSCLQTCETPVGEVKNQQSNLDKSSIYRPFTNAPSNQQHTHPHRHHAQQTSHSRHQYSPTKSPKVQMDRPNAKIYDGKANDNEVIVTTEATTTKVPSENICELTSPCQNNGTCVYDKLKKAYTCECINGYKGKDCTELDDRDPCAKHPCMNGATCINKPDKKKLKIIFDCFCATGFGGRRCEEKPCDPNPCKNNGTCRTTKGNPSFFCECLPEWGGNNCFIELPNTNSRTYGKNVQLLSSGKPEWIEDLRKHKLREHKPNSMEVIGDGANYTEPDNNLKLLNGTDKNMKSRTLRLPAGATNFIGSARLESNCLTALFSSLILFISTFLFLNA